MGVWRSASHQTIMKRKVFIFATVGIICVGLFWGFRKAYNKLYRLSHEISCLYEIQTMDNQSSVDILPHNVLCLGNSITHHTPNEKIGWYSDWGMAASTPEKDYCHQLEAMLKTKNNSSTVTPLNIAYWERNLNCNIDSILDGNLQGKDIVVIRLGENVQDVGLFQSKINELITICKKQTDKIIITGCFWEDAKKEECIIRAAYLSNIRYVPLFWIATNHKEAAYPKRTDKIKDQNGSEYTLTHSGVLIHPSDSAMRMIAECIYNCL